MFKCADFVASNMAGSPVPSTSRAPGSTACSRSARSSGAAVNFTLISHCGTCCVGVNSDSVAVPDQELLVEHFEAAIAEVLDLAR